MAAKPVGASAPAVFNFNTHAVRIVLRGDAPWFVAADVCAALEYRDTHNGIRWLDEHEKETHTLSTPGGDQKAAIISESGLYTLVLRSRKPEAKRFKHWVTAEVLPSIRKTGGYNHANTVHANTAAQTAQPPCCTCFRLNIDETTGQSQLTEIDPNAWIGTVKQLTGFITDPCGMRKTDVAEILAACVSRLAAPSSPESASIAETADEQDPVRAWRDPLEAEAILRTLCSPAQMYNYRLISPERVEQLATAGIIGPRHMTQLESLMV